MDSCRSMRFGWEHCNEVASFRCRESSPSLPWGEKYACFYVVSLTNFDPHFVTLTFNHRSVFVVEVVHLGEVRCEDHQFGCCCSASRVRHSFVLAANSTF